jgi:hypothetical protein
MYNPITGACQPRPMNISPGPDGGGDDDMGSSDPDDDMGTSDPSDDMGADLPTTCSGTERRCNGDVVERCVDGMFMVSQTCGDGLICERGNCIPEDSGGCTPGETRCAGEASFETCEVDGMSWSAPEACDDNETCAMGECTSGCAGLIDPKKSNEGCDYITMRHDQATGLQVLPHTVVVSNPSDTDTVTVQVTSPGGTNPGINQQMIQPQQSAVLDFPTSPMVENAGLSSNIYKISASRPVIATQFSPLNNPGLGSETSDASLLLPTNAVGEEYVVVGWRSLQPGGTYVDIVALEDDTMVNVESPLPLSGGAAGSVAENSSTMFSIPKDQVLHLAENRSLFDSGSRDVSGVRITANKPVAVYTGATIINIPDEPIVSNPPSGCIQTDASCTNNDECCSGICGYDPSMGTHHCMDSLAAGDHVEQQLFPVESWGTSYVASPFPSRGTNDFTMYRVVAANDGTTVTLDPPVNGVANFTLNAGEVRQLYGPDAFELTATQPVMLAQFMIGGSTADVGNGDPAFLLPPAIQQYRDSYVFLVPGNYVLNYVTLIKQAGVQITLDGVAVPQADFQPVGGSSGWEYAVVDSLMAGVHTASATAEFGVVVHGMDEYISYAFAGGVTLPEP